MIYIGNCHNCGCAHIGFYTTFCYRCEPGLRRESPREKGTDDSPPKTTQSTIPGPGTAGDSSVPSIDPGVPTKGGRT